MRFADRTDAGNRLAEALLQHGIADAVVYALPRGGVVLGVAVARALKAPLDLLLPRKVGHPFHPEYAVCAVTEDGHRFCNEDAEHLEVDWLENAIKEQQAEAQRRRKLYMGSQRPVDCRNKTGVIVDDGIATGLTMLAAIAQLKDREPREIILSVPVAPADTAGMLREHASRVITIDEPQNYLGAVGSYYDRFDQTEDEEVIRLLHTFQAE